MSGEKLVDVLVDIRNQQRQQIENFEHAIKGQQEYFDLQRRGRSTFLFLVYAPWAGMAVLLAYMLFEDVLVG